MKKEVKDKNILYYVSALDRFNEDKMSRYIYSSKKVKDNNNKNNNK